MSQKLLQGFENLTVSREKGLWQLAQVVKSCPELTNAFAYSADKVLSVITGQGYAEEFLAKFNGYLEFYGYCTEYFECVSTPSWVEKPELVIARIQDWIAYDTRNPEEVLVALVDEREKLIEEARSVLSGYPAEVREQFEMLLPRAQFATVLREDHQFWLDCAQLVCMRLIYLEYGKVFTKASSIEAADDVLYLTREEVEENLENMNDLKSLVSSRKEEMKHFATIQPPPALGSFPPGPPPNDVLGRALGKHFGQPIDPSQNTPGTIKGHAGSSGKVIGTARVIKDLTEATKFQPSEILVVESTAPSWTPLFRIAAGVVTDCGGVLSHSAIVAREYKLPAVVGTMCGTAAIKDGQLIEVDGDKGIVRIVG